MKYLENIISLLQSFRMTKPTNYSLFHIICLIIIVLIFIFESMYLGNIQQEILNMKK